ncbi:MAG: RNB domain-containing ribonuclease, partial [Rickettsiales bacterium]|nr:RNB domain-containing ribonuclease [Rickettsiales bacterium]
ISSEASSSYIAVQGCMIAAGEAAARLMQKSNFLFCNQSVRLMDVPNTPVVYSDAARRAVTKNASTKMYMGSSEYGAECRGHYGIGSNAFSHVTSPIRRYADVVNQRMLHWSVDVVEAVSASAWEAAGKPDIPSKSQLMHGVWVDAPDLLAKATAFKEAGRNRTKIDAGKQLEDGVIAALSPVIGAVKARMAAQSALRKLDGMELPYTKKEMKALAESINEKTRRTMSAAQYDELMNATLDAIFLPSAEPDDSGFVENQEYKQEAVRRRRPHKFAELLDAAARRGDNNDFFTEEVLRRFGRNKNGEVDPLVPDAPAEEKVQWVRNLYTLLVVADRSKDSRWDVLKRVAFQMIKDDPNLAGRVFNYLHAQHRPPMVHILETSSPDQAGKFWPTALVVLHHEGEDYSAPIPDPADTPDAARERAVLSFFRNFGKLSPYKDLTHSRKLNNLALARARIKKGERLSLLKTLCEQDFTVEEHVSNNPVEDGKCSVVLRITRKDNGETLEKTRTGWTSFTDEYLDKCAKDIIEDYRFVDMLAQMDAPVVVDEVHDDDATPTKSHVDTTTRTKPGGRKGGAKS